MRHAVIVALGLLAGTRALAQPLAPGTFPIQSVLGVVPVVDIPAPLDELADTIITVSHFRDSHGAIITPASVSGTVTDLATGAQLFAFGPVTPTNSFVEVAMPGANNPIVEPGLCSFSRAQVCHSSGGCPSGESCLPIALETHALELVFPGGTKQVLFNVKNHYFLPLP